MGGAGLLFRNVGPETKALGFSNAINFPALWTCGQDDELMIDNQELCFRRTAKSCLNTERRSPFTPRRRRMGTTHEWLIGCRIAVIPSRRRLRCARRLPERACAGQENFKL
jgi:hypothetical protein